MPTLTSSTGGADSETRIVSPMPAREQGAERRRGLDGALERRSGLGDAEVQRPVAALGEHLVGLHHHDRVVVLDRDLEVVEVVLLEQRRLPDGRLDERLRRGLAVLLEQPLVERAGVDADPDRRTPVLGGLGDLLDLVVELADVAGVDAYGGAAGVDGGEDVLRLEVDVGDHRELGVLGDLLQRVRVVLRSGTRPGRCRSRRRSARRSAGAWCSRRRSAWSSSTAPRPGRPRRRAPCRP